MSVTGATGGLAGVGMGDGGLGSDGMLRFTIPTLSTVPGNILIINPGATIDPGADTTSFLQ